MSSEILLQKISYDKAYRKNRLEAATWVLNNDTYFPELLRYCFIDDKELAKKATWVLEFVCREKLALLFPHLNYFFEQLPNAQGHGALRSVSLICELLCIQYYNEKNATLLPLFSEQHKEVMTECCFEWMISGQKVACEARAMLALYYLGKEQEWIHPALGEIIHKNIAARSAGYQARGKNVLQNIATFTK